MSPRGARRFFFVEREEGGRLGTSRTAPLLRGRTGALDKRPWNAVEPPRGPVERRFLRPVVLGESVAPFRLLDTPLAVIPVEDGRLLDFAAAAAAGFPRLAAWLRDCEAKWDRHARRRTDGRPRMTLLQRLDHMRGLTRQLAVSGPRVVYTKAGTNLSCCVVNENSAFVDHMAYWGNVGDVREGFYISLILNSKVVADIVAPMQARGSSGRRHFDMLVWELPIPEFDPENALHREIAALGAECERTAAGVVLPEGDPPRKRRAIREALADAGLAARADALVARLLGA